MIRAALEAGCHRLVLGVGGSASTDGGAGLLAALGARLLDAAGAALPPGGGALVRLDRVDLADLHPGLAAAEVEPPCGPRAVDERPGPGVTGPAGDHRGRGGVAMRGRGRRPPVARWPAPSGRDWALVRLGMPGLVRGVVVDTAFFKGNYPPEVSVEGAAVEGYPSPAELAAADWTSLVPRSAVKGDAVNEFPVGVQQR